jgi:diguanylate cyclase (GGDEF)-like protein
MTNSTPDEKARGGLWSRLSRRLRQEFELAVLVSFSGLATLVISGMAVYRFSTGNFLGGIINSGIAIALATVVVFALISPRIRLASIIFALIATAGCIISTVMLGRTGVLWGYVVLWVNFLLVPRQLALLINLFLLTALATQSWLFETGQEHLTFVVTGSLVIGFGFIFARRFSAQRQLLEELASHDPLTGAGNRRLMKKRLEKAIVMYKLYAKPSTLVVIDLDHFKAVNDQFGHEAGDAVLERFSAQVRNILRSEDGFFRLGGEEFVLLLPGMDRQTAEQALPDLHKRLSGTIDGPDGPIFISAGAAVLADSDNWSSWLARADSAMYQAKRAGRNCIHFACHQKD